MFIRCQISSLNFGKIWNKCKAGIIILVFIKKAYISEAGCFIRPEIRTDTFEFFFYICLIKIFFSLLVLVLSIPIVLYLLLLTQCFFGQVVTLLANNYRFNLL